MSKSNAKNNNVNANTTAPANPVLTPEAAAAMQLAHQLVQPQPEPQVQERVLSADEVALLQQAKLLTPQQVLAMTAPVTPVPNTQTTIDAMAEAIRLLQVQNQQLVNQVAQVPQPAQERILTPEEIAAILQSTLIQPQQVQPQVQPQQVVPAAPVAQPAPTPPLTQPVRVEGTVETNASLSGTDIAIMATATAFCTVAVASFVSWWCHND